MAAQANGITVVEVDNNSHTILFYVGTVAIRYKYIGAGKRWKELSRSSLDGARTREAQRIPEYRFLAIIRQAHAIAREHCW